MKTVLLIVGAAMALTSASAVAQNAPQVFDWGAQAAAYPDGGADPQRVRQCFNGKSIAGINRAGAQTLYVQPAYGGVYRMRLEGDCAALNAATKVSMTTDGADMVCPGERAQLVAQTASGLKQCRVAGLKRLNNAELSALSSGR